MHIPDGFLDTRTWVTLDIVAGGMLCLGIRKINKKIGEKQVPLMGVVAAFIFVAQMLNFPVIGGSSGHFIGGVLAAILLGPFSGILIMTVILVIQCLVFQDGGLTALGANIFNMGIVGSFSGYYIYVGLGKLTGNRARSLFLNSFFAGWLSIVLAAGSCAIELAVSGTVPLKVCLAAMVGVHAFIGIGEGLITLLTLSFIKKTRPDLLNLEKV